MIKYCEGAAGTETWKKEGHCNEVAKWFCEATGSDADKGGNFSGVLVIYICDKHMPAYGHYRCSPIAELYQTS